MATEINIVDIDALHQTYTVSFFDDLIHTTVTADADTVARWISEIERPNLYIAGLSIHFRDSDSEYDYLTITSLELCVGGRCLVYQLDLVVDRNHPQALVDFVGSGEYTFAGVIFPDLKILDEQHGLNIPEKYLVELRILTTDRYYGRKDLGSLRFLDAGLRELGETVLERELADLTEIVNLSWWDSWRLTSEQVKVASVEVFVSFEIGRILEAREYMHKNLETKLASLINLDN
ncbi:hypothetical protein CDL12_02272 [Handroanthus impetiginosus]|uniref:Uncharacterized protein n=1 Tax=Handroanthus impetiginosus TaxID=429701 RepID=A0A2G9I5W1_9LAMI|nr:hypothetical protein CDL12_02272 [Handroanthus impetiginosus]